MYLKYLHTGVLDPKVPKWVDKFWKPLNPQIYKYFGASDEEAEEDFFLYQISRCTKLDNNFSMDMAECQCDIPQLCNVSKNRINKLKMHRKRFSNGAKARNSK